MDCLQPELGGLPWVKLRLQGESSMIFARRHLAQHEDVARPTGLLDVFSACMFVKSASFFSVGVFEMSFQLVCLSSQHPFFHEQGLTLRSILALQKAIPF